MDNDKYSEVEHLYATLGSGDLVSYVHRYPSDNGYDYLFAVERVLAADRASAWLRREDLHALVKLCQVLAFEIANDGWMGSDDHQALFKLAEDLDRIAPPEIEVDDGC